MSDNALWRYVEDKRTELGWSQADLAARAGKDRQIFTRMRHGGKLKADTLIAVARVLDVPAAELMRLQGDDVAELGVISADAQPREITREELLRRASVELTADELLAIVRSRMRDIPESDDPLEVHETVPLVQQSEREYTGRRRPPRKVDRSSGRGSADAESGD